VFVLATVVVVPFTIRLPDSVRLTAVAVPVNAGDAKVAYPGTVGVPVNVGDARSA